MPAPLIALVDVGQVYLDSRQPNGRKGIANRIRIVSVGSRIDYDAVRPLKRLMNCIDDLSLAIELENPRFHLKLAGAVLDLAVHFIEGILAVDVWFADT